RGLGGEAGLDVGVEISRHVFVPVSLHLVSQPLVGLVAPPPAEYSVGLIEAEQMLGEGDLADPLACGSLAVGGELLDRRLPGALPVGPQVEVVVEHEARL